MPMPPQTGKSHGPGPGQDQALKLQQLPCFPPPQLAQEDRGRKTGMQGLQLEMGWRWEHTVLAPACTRPTEKSTTTPHVQVPVLDVELLCLKCQASRMSLKPREGELVTVRGCAEAGGGMLSHPLPDHRLQGLSPSDGEDSQALVLLPQRCSSPGEHDVHVPHLSMGNSNTFWRASAQA